MQGQHQSRTIVESGRLARVGDVETSLLGAILTDAPRGLAAAYDEGRAEFAQTVRGLTSPEGVVARREGSNLRYDAMALLGLARVAEDVQRRTLGGRLASEATTLAAQRARTHADPGAVALCAWADAEVNGHHDGELFERLATFLRSGDPLPTVDVSWMLTAATVAHALGPVEEIVSLASKRLLSEQGARGIYAHLLPASSGSRWRAHVGSFADQVYPLQALARASVVTGDQSMLAAANATADRICELQGPQGQWWWHYDFRDGEVVERFPVYSVHQHAMAPMVLFDLLEAGGHDHTADVAAGVRWLGTHPEVVEELISPRFGLVWRKVGRREPPKAARAVHAATTSVRPGLHLPGLDRALPPVKVDYECRPYELGWLLYAWLDAPGSRDG